MRQRGYWAIAAAASLFVAGIIIGWTANELLSSRWVFHDGGVRMNTRTGETWKMLHSTRQWVHYSDAPNDTPPVIIQDQLNARAKELEQKYGIDKQPPPLSLEELDRLSGVKTAPAKQP